MTEKYTYLRGVSVALRGIFCRNDGKNRHLMTDARLVWREIDASFAFNKKPDAKVGFF